MQDEPVSQEDVDLPSEEEIRKLATSGLEEMLGAVKGEQAKVDVSGYVDVSVEDALKDNGQPDFVFLNTYRFDAAGKMMRIRVEFNEVDDPLVGMAYVRAISSPSITKEKRQAIERALWRAHVRSPAVLFSREGYAKLKAQSRAELSTYCLARQGLGGPLGSGIDRAAHIPAGSPVTVEPETPTADDAPSNVSDASAPGSPATAATLTPSSTSTTSPSGTAKTPSTSLHYGPAKRSKRPGSAAGRSGTATG